MVSFWGHVALSYSSARTRGLHFRPQFSILGTNQPFSVQGPTGRDKMVSRRALESRLFCGGTGGSNQLSTTLRNPSCVVSRASQWVLGACGAASVFGEKAAEVSGPARPFQSRGRCSRQWSAGPRPADDRSLQDTSVQSVSK